MSEISIRTMDISDYENVYEIWLRTPGMGLNDKDDSREGIARYLLRNPKTCFVAEARGEIIGAIIAGHDGRRGIISHTAVRSEFRGMGAGRALVEAALEAFRREQISKVFLVAFKTNEGGNAFWEKMGFSVRNDLNYRDRALIELKKQVTG